MQRSAAASIIGDFSVQTHPLGIVMKEQKINYHYKVFDENRPLSANVDNPITALFFHNDP